MKQILGIIATVLLTLKIVGVEPVASWSWWWVLAPILVIVGVILVLVSGACFVDFGQGFSRWRTARAKIKWAKKAALMEAEMKEVTK